VTRRTSTDFSSYWLKFFDDQLTKRHIQRPALLVLDGHFSHINGTVLEYAVSHSIDLFVLPAHTSHFTQHLEDKVFSTLKRNYERLLDIFPVMFNHPQPTKYDLARLVSLAWDGFSEPTECVLAITRVSAVGDSMIKKWSGAVDAEFVTTAFRRTGIFPLSLEVMLGRIIGSQPVVTDLPNVAFVVDTPSLTDRQCRSPKRQGIAQDAVTAAFLGLKQLALLVNQPPVATRSRTYVEGGVLMASPEMVEAIVAAEAERDRKALAKEALAKERALKRRSRE
jgi:hypothetical protein